MNVPAAGSNAAVSWATSTQNKTPSIVSAPKCQALNPSSASADVQPLASSPGTPKGSSINARPPGGSGALGSSETSDMQAQRLALEWVHKLPGAKDASSVAVGLEKCFAKKAQLRTLNIELFHELENAPDSVKYLIAAGLFDASLRASLRKHGTLAELKELADWYRPTQRLAMDRAVIQPWIDYVNGGLSGEEGRNTAAERAYQAIRSDPKLQGKAFEFPYWAQLIDDMFGPPRAPLAS